MANKISVVIEATVDKATAGINNFKKAIGDAEGATGKFKAGAGAAFDALKANAGVASLAAGAALIKFGGIAVDAASNLEESMNAVNVTFGDSADAIHALGETSAESFGLSQRAFNDAAVQFSAFAKQVTGPGGDVSATMEDLIGRATDFASVMNLDVNEAMSVFQSTLAGETEPIRKFGKDVSAAAVEQYALAKGLIESKSELTESIKVQARYGLLMEQTNDVAGDFANTQDGLANSQRILKANVENLSAAFGKVLTPEVARTTAMINDLVTAAESLPGPAQSAGGSLFDSFRRAVDPIYRVQAAVEDVQEAFGGGEEAAVEAAAAIDNYTESQTLVNDAIRMGIAAQNDADEALAAATTSYKLVTDAIDEAKSALDAETDAIHRVNDARKTSIDRIYDAREAERSWWETVRESQAVLDDSTAGTLEKSAALDAVALATAETTAKQLAAQGVDIASVAGQKQYLEALKDTAAGLSGPMKTAVLEYIALLEGIPAQKVTTLKLVGIGTGGDFAPIQTGKRARGGPVAAGGAYLVGEEGPELITPSAGGFVHDANKTAGMLGGGGNTYINVNVNDSNAVRIASEIARKQRFNR